MTWSGGGRALSNCADTLNALRETNEWAIFGTSIICARADDLVVDPLFDDVRAPARSAGENKQGRKHRRRPAHHVVRDSAVPIEICEHVFLIPHDAFDPLSDIEQVHG